MSWLERLRRLESDSTPAPAADTCRPPEVIAVITPPPEMEAAKVVTVTTHETEAEPYSVVSVGPLPGLSEISGAPVIADEPQWLEPADMSAADEAPAHGGMTNSEIDAFEWRLERLTGRGFSLKDAEALGMQFKERDREGDDRRMCIECDHLPGRSCAVAGTPKMPGTSRGMRPVRMVLWRCDAFQGGRHEQV